MAEEPRPDIEDAGNSDITRTAGQTKVGQNFGFPGGERDSGASVIKQRPSVRSNGNTRP